MDLVGYLRVSSEGQLDGYGLDRQERDIKRWAKANGHRLVHWCRDEGRSGALDVADRPGLACAVDAISSGLAKGVIVGSIDRLARALTVQEAALALVWKLGGTVFTAEAGEVPQDDPDDPMRTAIRQVMGVFAELDRKNVTKRLRDGRRAKAATGKKAVGAYGFGYRAAGKGRERDAAPDPSEQVAVRRIIELRREGASYRQIAAKLDAEGLPPRRAECWSPMSVRSVAERTRVA
jgi:DNA invertase Pin-like site-specific DNA recombinase